MINFVASLRLRIDDVVMICNGKCLFTSLSLKEKSNFNAWTLTVYRYKYEIQKCKGNKIIAK